LGEHHRRSSRFPISFSTSRRKGERQSNLTAMNKPARILVVDDSETNRDILVTRLSSHGYECLQAADGEEALAATAQHRPDLILLDVMMPKLDGFEVCRRLKKDTTLPLIPIILVTAKGSSEDVVAGLEAGADEYLTKPIDQAALVARVRSMLRIKALHDQVAEWNKTLEQRVTEQVAEIGLMNKLKGFLSPQIAKVVLSSGGEKLLQSHRRDVTVVFCDLRGFTAFTETAEPEDTIAMLQEYYRCLGESIDRFEGTLEHFAGDGLLTVFNDPIPCEDPCARAVRMAVEMRERVAALAQKWRRFGYQFGFGVGIAAGHATLGSIGYEGRCHYSTTGQVVNLAARLCAQAADGQILVDGRVQVAVEPIVGTEPVGELELKGFHRAIRAFNVRELKA
jgi:class 3 adenylate cyclase